MNFDGGRYFLNVLAPLKTQSVALGDGEYRAPAQIVREVLASLPVAQQDGPSIESGRNSPFAQVPRTHFVRIFVIEQLRYNGRRRSNAIRDLLLRENLLKPQKIDRFSAPYLVFTADFDAPSGDATHLESYVRGLWIAAEREIRLIFGQCRGFEGVEDAESFCRYMIDHQVATTMPFTDYWTGRLPAWTLPRHLAIGVGAVFAAALALWYSGAWPAGGLWLTLLTLLAMIATAIALVLREGLKVWPAAPHSDIDSVLKSLYLQQKFVRFAIDQQCADDRELYDSFGVFVRTHRPDVIASPTHPPGTLRAPEEPR